MGSLVCADKSDHVDILHYMDQKQNSEQESSCAVAADPTTADSSEGFVFSQQRDLPKV